MNTWIFQVNPKFFDIDPYLRNNKKIIWEIKQRYLADDILVGDKVYIWRANGNVPDLGGVVGVGRIMSLPEDLEDDAPELWIQESPIFPLLCVRIEMDEVRLTPEAGMLKRSFLKTNPVLKDMLILRFYQKTNYLLEDSEEKALDQLWKENKRRK